MRTNKKLIAVLLFLGFLYSCSNSVVEENEDLSLGKQWLQNLVCEFPCWQNITPEKTNFDDARLILEEAKLNITYSDARNIEFQANENISGSISKAPNALVNFITLNVLEQGISAGAVAQAIGPPKEIVLFPNIDMRYCNVSLLFPEKETILDFYLKNDSKESCRIVINSDSQVFRIVLLGNKIDEFLQNAPYSAISRIEWKDYGEYP